MTVLMLKIIACFSMLSDHIGYTFSITEPYRYIGRLALPIYAFLITEGYIHTRNIYKYILRLTAFAFISEIPFDLFCAGSVNYKQGQNVFFTLSLALLTILILDKIKQNSSSFITIFVHSVFTVYLTCTIAEYLNSDYGYNGILLVLCFRYFKKHKLILFISVFLTAYSYVYLNNVQWSYVQLYRVFALIPIFLYNGKKGFTPANPFVSKLIQFGFYAFYPVHMLVLYYIDLIL